MGEIGRGVDPEMWRDRVDCGLIQRRRCLSLSRRAGLVTDLGSPQFGLPNGPSKMEQLRISKGQRLGGTSDHRLWLRYRTLLRHCNFEPSASAFGCRNGPLWGSIAVEYKGI